MESQLAEITQPFSNRALTSYYSPRWGFCLEHNRRIALTDDQYFVKIDSSLFDGELNYGELIIKGKQTEEILISTYICHPSMENNELSGPVVTAALAQWLNSLKDLNYTYRVVFVPETIGALVYLSRNIEKMKLKTKAGFVITCVGDERAYSFLPSRNDGTLSDRVARLAFRDLGLDYVTYSFLERGSDERQYCSPGVDLPISSIMRSKYGVYPEYHTSLDNLDLISQAGLEGALAVYKRAIEIIEVNRTYRATTIGEPQLGKRGLYSTLSQRGTGGDSRTIINFLAYCDGTRDLIGVADLIKTDVMECADIASRLLEHGLIEILLDLPGM
jgi:aminopeptidase-like protein